MLAYANYPEEFDTFQMYYCECRQYITVELDTRGA